MPGSHISEHQMRLYMQLRQKTTPQALGYRTAAAVYENDLKKVKHAAKG